MDVMEKCVYAQLMHMQPLQEAAQTGAVSALLQPAGKADQLPSKCALRLPKPRLTCTGSRISSQETSGLRQHLLSC